ncbi:MAG: disulfide bond formation protein B [Alphaproteobacteria bacterium]|nr:disulfide bond formation protein B [Alphaproteobacteria bacterium]
MQVAAAVRWWPWAAAAVSGALLAGAHAFERFGNLAPCILCLRQREAHWAVLGVAAAVLAFAALRRQPPSRLAAAALGVAFLVAAGWAGYHVGVEFKWWPGPAACAGNGLGDISGASIAAALDGPVKVVRCEDIAWSLFGVSMAGWNGLVSLAMALASFTVAAVATQTQKP